MSHKHKYIVSLIGVAFLLASAEPRSLPSAVAQGQGGVTGIMLQAVPNAVALEWQKPTGVEADHYVIYYAKQSILENNGRYLDREETLGDETSLVLMDLKNRGFQTGETIYVTVTVVNIEGTENTTFAEEQSTTVIVPGTTPVRAVAEEPVQTLPGLENAVSQDLTKIRLTFSTPVTFPIGSPAAHFTVIKETTGNPIGVLSAEMQGTNVAITVLPMTPRSRYVVTVAATVTAADGTLLDPNKRTTPFVARGEIAPPPIVEEPPVLLELPVEVDTTPPEDPRNLILQELPPDIDTTPPEDPRNLVLQRELQSNGFYTVVASWKESLNSVGDLASYNLYESDNLGITFVGPTALVATVISATIANIPPGTLTVKLTAMDRIGNESGGIQKTIMLPETGAATVLLSLAGASWWAVRRKLRIKN